MLDYTWAWRWTLVDGFLERENKNHESIVSTSDIICVDEIISHWCGQGGTHEWVIPIPDYYQTKEYLVNF